MSSAAKKAADKRYDEKRKDKRARAWTCVVYPDGDKTPVNWLEIVPEWLIETLISPLHDQDRQEEDPEKTKKPHYHVVVSFKNPTSYTKAIELFDSIGGVYPDPETNWSTFLKVCKVKDFKQMARYLCHLDQPNKHQYDISQVQSFGSIDYQSLVMSSADEDEVIDAMCDFIDQHRIDSYVAFARYVRKERPEWKSLLYHKCSYFIRNYITAMAWANENGLSLEIDFDNGGSVVSDLISCPDNDEDKTAGQENN